jgi:hypothetical protein
LEKQLGKMSKGVRMPIITKKPLGNKLIKGRDHLLDCTSVWKIAGIPINFTTDVAAMYVTFKDKDSLDDAHAVISLNSINDPDQFIISDDGLGLTFWLKKEDQEDIVAENVNYCMDMVLIMTDGKEFSYINDYSIVFGQPPTLETGF